MKFTKYALAAALAVLLLASCGKNKFLGASARQLQHLRERIRNRPDADSVIVGTVARHVAEHRSASARQAGGGESAGKTSSRDHVRTPIHCGCAA